SHALQRLQRERGGEFYTNRKLDIVSGDGRQTLAALPKGSVKGLILSNELLDDFGSHKVALAPDGLAEVAFVIPQIPLRSLQIFEERESTKHLIPLIQNEDRRVREALPLSDPNVTYLSRTMFMRLIRDLAELPGTESEKFITLIQFRETFVPVRLMPELAEHLRANANEYSQALAASPEKGVVI